MNPQVVAEAIATAFLDGTWSATAMAKRAARALGQSERWLPALARRTVVAFPEGAPRDRFEHLAAQLSKDKSLIQACAKRRWHLTFRTAPVAMRDVHADWKLPRLDTTGDVAAWLGLEIGDLLWFADELGLTRHQHDQRLSHYDRRWLPKRSGGMRLVEAPKRWLKDLQRRILHELVDRIPPHEAAHGFRRRRGILTHAAAHAGRAVVLRMDLEDFFVSIPSARVAAVFHAAGYPLAVARVLTGLCTTYGPAERPRGSPATAEEEVRALFRTHRRYAVRHLPQGAPTSPALANLCVYGLDVRLSAAARAVDATYTRYADDLVFSGDLSFARQRFSTLVAGIVLEQGFVVQHRKTRLMRAAVRQEVTGLVVNRSPSIPRHDFERWKAILHNCVCFGPASQNRDGRADFRAHLEGVVAWASHIQPARGAKLAKLLASIAW